MKNLLMYFLISSTVFAQADFSAFTAFENLDKKDRIAQTLLMSNPCQTEGVAIHTTKEIDLDVEKISNKNNVGVTTEGDIAIISKQDGKAILDLYVCSRPEVLQAGNRVISQVTMLKLDTYEPSKCVADQMIADIYVQGGYGFYSLQFFPMYFINNGGLCEGEKSSEENKVSNSDRNLQSKLKGEDSSVKEQRIKTIQK